MNKDSKLIFEAYALNGLAAGLGLEAIAKKHGVDIDALKNEFEKGKKTEMEHTEDVHTAEKIAKDHLFEDPNYYTKLSKMEKENQETRAYVPSESNEENAEMPSSDFNKLKQHINKGPIKIKKPSKELPYTNQYIRDLAKKDSREEQQEAKDYDDVEVQFADNGVNYIAFGNAFYNEVNDDYDIEDFAVFKKEDLNSGVQVEDEVLRNKAFNMVYNKAINMSAEDNPHPSLSDKNNYLPRQ